MGMQRFVESSVYKVIYFSLLQLFKRRNVSLPRNDESMLESPIQDPDISSTVPIPEVDITKIYFKLYFNNISEIVFAANTIHAKYLSDKLYFLCFRKKLLPQIWFR